MMAAAASTSSASTPVLSRTRVSCGGIAKPISFLAPSSAARSTKNSVLFCSCSPSSSDAPVAPPLQAVEEEKKPSPAAGEEEKGEVSVGELAGLLDTRVGRVVKAWRHPEADTLYVEDVDVGEEHPRTICSGLVNYLPLDELQDSNVIVLANLKPRNMRGIKSNGMLMAASDASHETVELLTPPEGSVPGERVWFGSEDEKGRQSEPATPNQSSTTQTRPRLKQHKTPKLSIQVQQKKIWDAVQPHLRTSDNCTAALGEHPMRTSTSPQAWFSANRCRMQKCRNISRRTVFVLLNHVSCIYLLNHVSCIFH